MAPASMARHREHSTVSGGGQAGGAAVAADAAVSLPMPPVAALVAAAAPLHVIAAVCRRGGVAAAAAAVAGRRRRLPPALMWSSLPGVPLPYTYRRASRGRAHCVRGISCTRASSARAVRAHVSDRSLCIMYMHVFSLCVLMYGPFIAVWCADVQDAAQPPQRAPETSQSSPSDAKNLGGRGSQVPIRRTGPTLMARRAHRFDAVERARSSRVKAYCLARTSVELTNNPSPTL
jgi:hypothetical protein